MQFTRVKFNLVSSNSSWSLLSCPPSDRARAATHFIIPKVETKIHFNTGSLQGYQQPQRRRRNNIRSFCAEWTMELFGSEWAAINLLHWLCEKNVTFEQWRRLHSVSAVKLNSENVQTTMTYLDLLTRFMTPSPWSNSCWMHIPDRIYIFFKLS